MKTLWIRRFVALGIDYFLILVYMALLFGVTTLINPGKLSTTEAQVVGFISLTLPVFLYCFLSENSKYAGTIGKRVMQLAVSVPPEGGSKNIFIRNLLKFIPWEIAHGGVHWIFSYLNQGENPPNGVFVVLIIPQIIAFVYILSIFISKGSTSIYDKIAQTRILWRT